MSVVMNEREKKKRKIYTAAVIDLIEKRKIAPRALSRKCGKSESWLSTTINLNGKSKSHGVSFSQYVAIASAAKSLGYDLIVEDASKIAEYYRATCDDICANYGKHMVKNTSVKPEEQEYITSGEELQKLIDANKFKHDFEPQRKAAKLNNNSNKQTLEYIPKEHDVIHHPNHYMSSSGLEAIDVIKAFTEDLKGYQAICDGNVIKYILRWPKKNGLEDLYKAKEYLELLIQDVESSQQ